MLEDADESLGDDGQIQHDGPVLDIPDVHAYTVLHLPQFLGLATKSANLCQTCDAGLAEMAHHVFVDELAVVFRMVEHVGARSDDTHVADQNIVELRQLVDVALSHEVAESELADIVLSGLNLVGILVDMHGTELIAFENLAVVARALLREEDGTGTLNLDDEPDDGNQRNQANTYDETEDDVEGALDKPVGGLFQRFAVVSKNVEAIDRY